MLQRRDVVERDVHRGRVAQSMTEDLARDRMAVRVRIVLQRELEIADACGAHAALVELGGLLESPERRIAAVARTDDADAIRVGDLLVDEVAHACRDVVLHREAPLAVAGFLEALAEARRAAELRLEDG